MSEKKKLNKEQLDNVTGGDYGRQWKIDTFRQDYSTNNTETPDTNSNNQQSSPENNGVYSDFMSGN